LNPLRTYSIPRANGFTLLELLIVVVITGILLATAVPWLGDLVIKNRLRGAAEEAQSMLQFARSEAVKRNEDVYVTFDDATWCFGASMTSGCDCALSDPEDSESCRVSIAGSPVLKRVVQDAYRNVSLVNPAASTPFEVQYDHHRGLTTDNGTLTFRSEGLEIQVKISVLGRVRMCSPSGAGKVLGYEDCE
jgi:type IV fimbrial biogenesis protein FimT